MFKLISSSVCILFLLFSHLAQANIEVKFIEGAPKDRFIITNTGKCPLQDLIVEIDLSKSAGKLIFDTTATGAGVEVFQPFEVTRGDISLMTQDSVKDGDAKLLLSIPALAPRKAVSFTIDVDDTLPVSALGKIRVAGSEIKNGLVKVSSGKQKSLSGSFGSNSKATVLQPACTES